MQILFIIQKSYGKRIVDNISSFAPRDWEINTWVAPPFLPPIIEEPEEFLPQNLPQADLLISLGEATGIAELIPALNKLSKTNAVIAPCDNQEWLPPGLKNQIKKELENSNISCAFPSPFCSLTEKFSNNKYIKSFARYFGKPKIVINCKQDVINTILIQRESPCGSTRFIAKELRGIKIEEAGKKAGLLHHYYPCLASGKIDLRFKDSLLHQSAKMTQLTVKKALSLEPHQKNLTKKI